MNTPTTFTIDTAKLTGITLTKGSHRTPEGGLCYVEWLAYVAGLPHSDRPDCVSPVLGEMGRSLSDVLPDDLRQRLLVDPGTGPLGTAGDGHDEARSYLALDWLIRTWLPTWLDLSPACREDAAKVRKLDPIVDARLNAYQIDTEDGRSISGVSFKAMGLKPLHVRAEK